MLILKQRCKGVDAVLDRLQRHIYAKLYEQLTNWNCHHRAYKNPKTNERGIVLIPEVYNINGEYEEVFLNDSLDVLSFFVVNDERKVNSGNSVFNFSLIVECNLSKIFPFIPHRADEEVISLFEKTIIQSQFFKYLTGVKTGIDSVYNEFDKSNIKYDDMSNFCVFRFEFENVKYDPLKSICNINEADYEINALAVSDRAVFMIDDHTVISYE